MSTAATCNSFVRSPLVGRGLEKTNTRGAGVFWNSCARARAGLGTERLSRSLLVLAIGASSLPAILAPSSAAAQESRCTLASAAASSSGSSTSTAATTTSTSATSAPVPALAATPTGSSAKSPSPVKPASRTLSVNLGSDPKKQTRSFNVNTPPLKSGQRVIAQLDGDLERSDSSTLPVGQVSVTPTVTELGDIALQVCLDPDRPQGVAPGRYVGAISIGGAGIETTSFPLEATVQASGLTAIVWIFLGTALGLVLKMLADLQKAPNVPVDLKHVWSYVKQGVFLFAIVSGAVAGIVDFLGLYEPNPAWGSSLDEIKVFVAAIALQTTGMTISDVIKPYIPKP